MKVRIINKSDNKLPEYETEHSAGMDVRAYLPEGKITLKPLGRALIKTGIQVELPKGMELGVRSRSGLAYKKGVIVLNAPGTVDADYRGDVGVILINLGEEEFVVESGDRIAQFVFAKHETVEFEVSNELESTERGEGGFGSTGNK